MFLNNKKGMDNNTLASVVVASLAGGVLKVLKAGKMSIRRWLTELIGAVIIGLGVFNYLHDYTGLSFDITVSLVSISAILWTHVLDIVKEHLAKELK